MAKTILIAETKEDSWRASRDGIPLHHGSFCSAEEAFQWLAANRKREDFDVRVRPL